MSGWRTPRWWYRRSRAGRAFRTLLSPLGAIWARQTARRLSRSAAAEIGAPVICVGNLTVGGSGKTPTALAVATLLAGAGMRPWVVSRGHGGRLTTPTVVELDRHGASDVGDEALMTRRYHPVVVARDRAAGGRLAVERGADMIVLDDGHQNPSLKKRLSIVVVDAEIRDGEWPFGDGGIVPAGPLREPLAVGLARADAVIALLSADAEALDPPLRAVFGSLPVWIARWANDPPPPGPRVGFAGVAKPWRVERALRAAGCDLREFHALADHAPITSTRLGRFARRASAMGAALVTTEKDWVRLPPDWRDRVTPWRARVRFDDEEAVLAAILEAGRA